MTGSVLSPGMAALILFGSFFLFMFMRVPVAFALDSNHRDGYTVGGGVEYMFAPNWSAKAEYQYYNFGSTTITSGPADVVGVRGREDEHTVKVGVNYRFGWGGPVGTRY